MSICFEDIRIFALQQRFGDEKEMDIFIYYLFGAEIFLDTLQRQRLINTGH